MKWNTRTLSEMERRTGAAGESIAGLCRRAGVNQTSWTLWKYKGVRPRPATWEKIERAVRQIEAEYHAARAA
jgi:hypothetical protein